MTNPNHNEPIYDTYATHDTVELATEEYGELMRSIDQGLVPNHRITYIPHTPEQILDQPEHFRFSETAELPSIMADADMILCISRDENLNPDYTDQQPTHNIELTPSGKSNVDTSVELFKIAQAAGNTDIKFVSTGRMHNRQIKMMLALPVLAEAIGINAEDAYHIPESTFKELLDATFTPEHIARLELDESHETLAPNYNALKDLMREAGYTPGDEASEQGIQQMKQAADAIFEEYKNYPRISVSRLMIERAVEGGVPLEAMYEEDGAVDTISNMINVTNMMLLNDELKSDGENKQRVVIVAGSDHLPRTTWIADHILPDDREIISVESDPALDSESYAESCERERLSFGKGSKWIGGTRDINELGKIVEAGYFGTNRKTAEQIAKDVATLAFGDNTSTRH